MTTNTPQPNVPGDEVDRLLGAYFLLIGSCWYLSGAATNGHRRPDTTLGDTTADAKHAKDAGKDPPKRP